MESSKNLPPGPKGLPIFGSLFDFFSDMLGFMSRAAKVYGDVVYFRLFRQRAFLLNHPDLIKDVLVTHNRNFTKSRALERSKIILGNGLITSEGDYHLRQRRLAQPAFHQGQISNYAKVMIDYASKLSAQWQDGETIDLHIEMMGLTLKIVTKSLYDTEVESETEEISNAVSVVMGMFRRLLFPFSEYLDKLPLPGTIRFQKAREVLDKIVYRIIELRRRSSEDRGDLLSMFLTAQDEEGDHSGMTDLQVRDEVMTLFLAGHETVANALTWTFYLISQYPETEKKLLKELTDVLGNGLPSPEDADNLKYTRMVLTESMRLYPPVWTMARRAINDYKVREYLIPSKSVIFFSQYLIHRDLRFYNEPNLFIPERWTKDNENSRPQYSYFPFGGGPRRCIGEHFAWMEGILVLATLIKKWKMRLAPGQRVDINPLITLRPKFGLKMILEKR